MSRKHFYTVGIVIGKLPSRFPTFGIWNRNAKSNSHFLALGMEMKNQIPNFWEWELKENLIYNIWEWEIASSLPKSWECNWKFQNASSTSRTMLSLPNCANSCLLFNIKRLSLLKVYLTLSTDI